MADFKRGDTFVKTFQISNGNVADWSEWQGRAQIRANFEDGELLAELDFTWIDTASGTFTISTSDTQHFPQGRHVYDVEVTNGDLKFSSPTMQIVVAPDVTKTDAAP